MTNETQGGFAGLRAWLASQADRVVREHLALSGSEWIELGLSLLLVVAAYLLGTWLIRRFLPRLARRTATRLDDKFLKRAGSALRWLLVVLALWLATGRLAFLSDGLKSALGQAYFVVAVLLAFRAVWSAISLVERSFTGRAAQAERSGELTPVITLLARVAQVVAIVIAITVLLSRFGIDVTAFAAALGIGGLAVSLAARDTIADAISGFVILVDRPFRVGDRIEIQGVGTWGDVTAIGLRTTRIRTRDNRMVIVPNSVIGTNQVVNYSYPDPRYRIETHVDIAYGTDVEAARSVLVEAVKKVPGVLLDRPIEALYIEMGDWAMVFRVRWWIESYIDTRRMLDTMHTALQHALDEAGIVSPYPTQSVHLQHRGGGHESAALRPPPVIDGD